MAVTNLVDNGISLLSPLVASHAAHESSDDASVEIESQWDWIQCELQRLRELEDDWDGQGSLSIVTTNLDAVQGWISEMRGWRQSLPPRRLVPGTAGELVLEWRGDAFQLTAEVSSPDKIEWLLQVPGRPVRQWETDLRCTWIVRSEQGIPSAAGSETP